MSKLARIALIAPFAAFAAVPAAAQDQAGDRVNMVIAYSEDECPEQTAENEIVVCQIVVEADRYRIPSTLRQSNLPGNQTQGQQFEKVRYIGEFGTMSCDVAGAGGFTGCTQQFIDAAYAEKDAAEGIRFAQLIEQARQERLSTIDGDAAAEQDRVEQIEREYLERLERERDAALPGERDASLTPPPLDMDERQIPAEPRGPEQFDDGDEEQIPLDAAPPADADGAG